MTAVVGILNKYAVAIAADSASTVDGSNGHKIFNKANKVFPLSDNLPVAVMLYNSASFMGTPWEVIINIYKKQLRSEGFALLKDYQEDFISFIKNNHFFSSEEIQASFVGYFAQSVIDEIVQKVRRDHSDLLTSLSEANKQQILDIFDKEVDSGISAWKARETCRDFEGYTFETFLDYSKEVFEKLNETNKGYEISSDTFQKLKELVFYILIGMDDAYLYTGLVFTGYGEQEIYPQLTSVHISIAFDNRLRFFFRDEISISNQNNGAICPFAQTDVIDTILSGIDPQLESIFLNNFEKAFKKYNEQILESIGLTNPLLTEQIKDLGTDAIMGELHKWNQEIKYINCISPLMDAVSSLAKEDLAEMAESLIYLTYLKRRITFAEESVGGPVDVAIISKGDGFIWIKRKQYIRPELNQHFMGHYYKI